MMDNGISPADIAALTKTGNDNEFGGGVGWIILLFIFLLAIGGGGGFFGGGGAAEQATQADIQRGFDTNTIVNKLDSLGDGICSLGYENAQLSNNIQASVAALGAQMQQCCCETNRNIDAVRYEAAKNTCDITSAIHSEGEATRALITQNTMQELRDQLQTAQFQLSQQAQNSTLISALRPFPIPSYNTCSPYTASNGFCCGCGNV